METEFVSIFQSLAYPVAVSVILFIAIGYFAKKMLEYIKKHEEENNKLRDQYIAYLQKANAELIGVVKENTVAFNSFSIVLEKIEKKLKTND